MGRKATLYLCDGLLAVATVVLLVLTCVCRYAASVDPAQRGGWMVLALAAPVIAALDAVALAGWLLRRRWLTALIPLVALVVFHPFLAANIQLRLPVADAPCDLKVVTFNVGGFRGEEGFRSAVQQVASLLQREGVDAVCFEEFRVTRDYDTLEVVRMMGMPYYAVHGSVAVLSRYPILESAPVALDTGEGNRTNGALWTDIDTPGGRVRLVACHLQTTGLSSLEFHTARESGRKTPVSLFVREMERQAALRARQIDRLAALSVEANCPVVLVGDFNDPPSSYTYHVAAGVLDDTFREGGTGWGGTFRRSLGLLRLDYVFVSKELTCRRCYTVKAPVSDHKPVFAELDFRREK